MKIPKKMASIKDKRVIIVTSGSQRAKIYFAQNGIMEIVHVFEELRPSYSDKEGFLVRSGRGDTYSFGSVYEDTEEERRKRLISNLVNGIARINDKIDIDQIYIFAPHYVVRDIKNAMLPYLQTRVKKTFRANVLNEHPKSILNRLTTAK